MLLLVIIALALVLLAADAPPLAAGAVLFTAMGFALGYVTGWNGAVDSVHAEDVGRADDAKARRVKRW